MKGKTQKKVKTKFFECSTCTEQTHFLSIPICSLRIKSIDDLQAPNESSICRDIKNCEFYRKIKDN